MKSLVLGSSGFLGSHLTESLLERGFTVVGVGRKDLSQTSCSHLLSDRFLYLSIDLASEAISEVLRQIDFDLIFDAIGASTPHLSWKEPISLWNRDSNLTLSLLEQIVLNNFRGSFIYLSSSSVYGSISGYIDENSLIKPVSPYGINRSAIENYGRIYARQKGFKFRAFRLFSVYGPRQRKQIVYESIYQGLKNRSIQLRGNGSERRDFLYVSDAIEGILHSVWYSEEEIINICSGRSITIKDLGEHICRVLGLSINSLFFDNQEREGDPYSLDCLPILLNQTGFKPKISLQLGLKTTAKWIENLLIPSHGEDGEGE